MDRRERFTSLNDMLLAAMQGWQSDIWTALPGIVNSFDPAKQTCEVQPAIQVQITNPDNGNRSWVTLPLLVDCPVFFPSGGGCTLTFPLVAGDECLVIFSSRCIDAWWQSGGIQNQPMLRMHDLSDGFVFAGIRSQPRKFTVSSTETQLRTDDGVATIGVNASTYAININTTGPVNVSTTGTATLKAASIILKNAGSALKKLVNDTFLTLFDSHTHTTTTTGNPTSVPNTLSSPSNATSVVQAE